MHSLMFVEQAPLSCGYQLTSNSFSHVPKGRIRIIRYSTAFYPQIGLGYYSDIYFRRFIRKWKYEVITKPRRLQEKFYLALYVKHTPIGNHDILSHIGNFI